MDDAAEAASAEQQVATGVVLDGPDGRPVDGVGVELLVWPAPQASGTTAPGEPPDLIETDEVVTGSDGSFSLAALAAELTPHARTGGSVGIEVRLVGSDQPGARTSVTLRRAADTGITSVSAVHDLVLVMDAGASGDGSEP